MDDDICFVCNKPVAEEDDSPVEKNGHLLSCHEECYDRISDEDPCYSCSDNFKHETNYCRECPAKG